VEGTAVALTSREAHPGDDVVGSVEHGFDEIGAMVIELHRLQVERRAVGPDAGAVENLAS
jgi:hypothetical protein